MGNCCVKYQGWEVIYWPDQQKHYNRNEDKGKDKENDNDTLKEQSWSSLYKYKWFHLSEVWGSKIQRGQMDIYLCLCEIFSHNWPLDWETLLLFLKYFETLFFFKRMFTEWGDRPSDWKNTCVSDGHYLRKTTWSQSKRVQLGQTRWFGTQSFYSKVTLVLQVKHSWICLIQRGNVLLKRFLQ